MEEINFKINKHNKLNFENDLELIFSENNTVCNQREFDFEQDFVIAKIPKYCLDKCTKEQMDLLKAYLL